MPRPRPVDGESPTVHYWLTWDSKRKRWVLSWSVRTGHREIVEWQYVDATAPIGVDAAAMIASAIASQIQGWLY